MIEVNPWHNDDDGLANWDAETLYTCTADSPVDVNIPELLQQHREYDNASVSVTGGQWCLPGKARDDDTSKHQQGRGLLSNSVALVTMLPRISAAQKELAAVRRSAVPMSLDRQRKILNDLLEITRYLKMWHIFIRGVPAHIVLQRRCSHAIAQSRSKVFAPFI